MSEMSNFDGDKIRAAVNRLDGIVDSMDDSCTKFHEAIARLDKGWVSEVKAAFMDNYEKDSEAMEEMLDQLREFHEAIQEAVDEFEEAESETLSDIRTLS